MEQFIAAEAVVPLVEPHLLRACHIVVWVVDIDIIDHPPGTYPIPEKIPGTLAGKVYLAHSFAGIVGIAEGEVDLA